MSQPPNPPQRPHNPGLDAARRALVEMQATGLLAPLVVIVEADIARCLDALEGCADADLPAWRREWLTHVRTLRAITGNPNVSLGGKRGS